MWGHLTEKDSRQINMLAQILVAEVFNFGGICSKSQGQFPTEARMISILNLIDLILNIYTWIIIAVVVMSWLIGFNIINGHNNIVRQIRYALYRLTEPVLGPIRRILPDLGGIDLSPIVALVAIWFIRSLMWEYGPRLLM